MGEFVPDRPSEPPTAIHTINNPDVATGEEPTFTGKVRLLKLLTGITIIAATVYLLVFIHYSVVAAVIANGVALAGYGLTLVFARWSRPRLARIWLFSVYVVHVFFLAAVVLGRDAGMQFFFLAVPPCVFLASEYEELVDKVGFSALSMLLLFVAETVDMNWLPAHLAAARNHTLFFMTMGFLQVGVFFVVLVFTRDIHDRDVVRRRLQKGLEVIRLMFDSASDALYIIDNESKKIVGGNQSAYTSLGYSREELLELNIWDIEDGGLRYKLQRNPTPQTRADWTRTWEGVHKRKDGTLVPVEISSKVVKLGVRSYHIACVRDLTERKEHDREREKLIAELEAALKEVKQLSGLLPICAGCKRIRDDQGYWNQIESYIQTYSAATFSHSICDECAKKLYGYDVHEEKKADADDPPS